ncbi:hypothetical protein BKH43_07790 [Helicobacter sp. 13S00401-1]|uniref:lipid A deacylase LpxR family protein n=1 Tax=Helicobacter sp. 13S00401-1 TaxID=1905758 RepID=UPI000BA5A3F3|nr:lipid A deacylase LpxR family protein [Helicobacter sp. 13S00401-1]PAF48609.1 hypothetical protein BKH43_07790 [Helicobacter sp. 13S00401-1]
MIKKSILRFALVFILALGVVLASSLDESSSLSRQESLAKKAALAKEVKAAKKKEKVEKTKAKKAFEASLVSKGYYRLHTVALISENDAYSAFGDANNMVGGYPDRFYTAGTFLGYISKDLESVGFLRYLDPFFFTGPKIARVSFFLTQKLYTPYSKDDASFDSIDRPYAGTLYGSFGLFLRDEDFTQDITLKLGVLGSAALGKQTQEDLHKVIKVPQFKGWDNQITNYPLIALAYDLNFYFRFLNTSYFQSDLILNPSLELGSVTSRLDLGIYARAGYGLDKSAIDNYVFKKGFYMFVFFGVVPRVVAYDLKITGDRVGFDKLSLSNLQGYFEYGIKIGFSYFQASFALVHQAKEFATQGLNNDYGSASLAFSF